jgi:hypothetical protein
MDVPRGLKIYRIWRGGRHEEGWPYQDRGLLQQQRVRLFSAVLMAAESGIKNVVILAFDILGAQQWEMDGHPAVYRTTSTRIR